MQRMAFTSLNYSDFAGKLSAAVNVVESSKRRKGDTFHADNSSSNNKVIEEHECLCMCVAHSLVHTLFPLCLFA